VAEQARGRMDRVADSTQRPRTSSPTSSDGSRSSPHISIPLA
jgi:hypothetical protein